MAILARKSGWIIGVLVVRETPSATIVRAWDTQREIRVPRNDDSQRLFECTDAANNWILEVNGIASVQNEQRI